MKYMLLLASVLGLSSCAQTGDPSSGGLFGWSESMYNADMNAKRDHLGAIQEDTQQTRAESAGVQRQINAQR